MGEIEQSAIAESIQKTANVCESLGLGMTGLAVAQGPKRDSHALCGMLRQVYDINDQLPCQMQAALDALAQRLAESGEQPSAAIDESQPMLVAPTRFAFA